VYLPPLAAGASDVYVFSFLPEGQGWGGNCEPREIKKIWAKADYWKPFEFYDFAGEFGSVPELNEFDNVFPDTEKVCLRLPIIAKGVHSR
jgi:hypothetical protein